jgi:hypothetical protein
MTILHQRQLGSWTVFPNTTFNLLSAASCDNAIEGVCYDEPSLEKCIELSERLNSEKGYYIYDPVKNNGFCVPLRKHVFNDMNPLFQLEQQNYHNELNSFKSFTFFNSSKISTSDLYNSNIIYYNDIAKLTDISNTRPNNNTTDIDEDQKLESGTTVSIVSPTKSTYGVFNYIPIETGDLISFSIPGTNLLLFYENNILIWKMSGEIIPQEAIFNFNLVTKSKYLVYEETFNLYQSDKFLGQFSLSPKMMGYYCFNGVSIPVALEDCKISKDRISRMYWKSPDQIIKVSRLNKCIENTNSILEKSRNSRNFYIVIAVAVIIILIIFILFIVRHK